MLRGLSSPKKVSKLEKSSLMAFGKREAWSSATGAQSEAVLRRCDEAHVQ